MNSFVTLGENIGLNIVGLGTDKFNIDFIQIIALVD